MLVNHAQCMKLPIHFVIWRISVRSLYRNLQYWTQREFFKCLRRISYLRHLFVVQTKEPLVQLLFLHYHD